MNNPIPKCSMFATPKNLEHLYKFIEGIPTTGGARASVIVAVNMALNYASGQVDKMLEVENV